VTMIMVDQLWMWILGDRSIITCCAQRWNTDFGDRDGIYARMLRTLPDKSENFNPTASDIAVKFMTACFGTLDRHAHEAPRLQFTSMFEQSIGVAGAMDSNLLREFSIAYKALNYLKALKESNKTSSQLHRKDEDEIVKKLSDLTKETDLLTELKDIRDELHIMNTILLDQQRVSQSMLKLQTRLIQTHRTSLSSQITVESAKPEDHEEIFEPIKTIVDQGLQDIAQLDAQATRLSSSVSELVQLKQAHYNSLELESSRDLAMDAAKQGRAVLVFTIVTIIFSPLSFVAAFSPWT